MIPAARLALWMAIAHLAAVFVVRAANPKLPDQFDVAAIDAFLTAQMERPDRVGLSVALLQNGQPVLVKGYGKRSLEDGRAVDTNTMFAIGSVSKQFTCAAVLLLAEDGKLSVHDKVAKFYPKLTRANEISLLDLMHHTAGYPDYYPLDFVDRRMLKAIAEDELLAQYAGGKLDFEPGARWSYSNTGYILLGRVVEKVSGESLGKFLGRRIFRPLGMTSTFYETETPASRLATGYATFALSPPEPMAPEAQGWLRGAGGLYSTPADLAKWNLALVDGKVLKPESYALMTAPRKLTGGRIAEYGCGVSVRIQSGRQVISHNGAVSGFNAYSAVIPSTRSSVILLANLEGGLGTLPTQLLGLLLKEQSSVPIVEGLSTADAVKLVFAEIQKGEVNRQRFSDEFNHFLTAAKVESASQRLKPYGAPTKAEVISSNERGGMEVTTTRLTFPTGDLRVLMYRQPSGVIEQYFVSKD